MSFWERVRWRGLGILGRFFLRIWAKTSRISIVGREEYNRAKAEGKAVIFLIWHGRLMLAPYFFRKQRIAALVSPSQDGEIIARIAQGWGFRIIRGSGSHSMVRAWIEMKEDLGRGGELIIVPDGPRGPDRKLKAGAVKLAQETGARLVPWTYSASRKKRLKSWDRFLFFYPFSRIVAIYGNPLAVGPGLNDDDFEKERQRVEEALNALDAEAEAHFS